ncbi:Clavaminate synthase-like protein [Gloeophyllum trabeum ATCC 11539]|uniref:Clavaminate synthase-like protein n=1 Tax=Gloeophyllum trabeum (strain ATCC 11539 / FP-39264 / Madison 617) TaxID=670483 RepID=S7Q013_GLOTA|nr:Clavaminate synthase-like protein [Gloeophyllum trabeum ATCC 11539]EPQ53023.1 Clavaminate synthase-like protein [Gloeophyllum trabeum ATCC 11539]
MSSVKLGDAGDISILDFGPFLDGTNKQAVADAVLASFREMGFVYLVNHGLPQDKIDGMFGWAKKFFNLPLETKQLAPHPPSGTHHRGYSAPGLEKVTQHVYDDEELKRNRSQAPDVKESFESGREGDPYQPNIWLPDDLLPGFREACLDFFWTCREVELSILRALALGFRLPEDYFVKYHTASDNQLRLLHYPSVPVESLTKERVTRIGAHSDFGSITLLMQDQVGGLEVEDVTKPGQFKPAPPVEGSIIVNAGDFLQRWSNDIIRSTVHRVRAPPHLTTKDGMTPERYSIPYDMTTVVDCIPGTYSEERPKRYEPISAAQYIMKRLAASY